MKIGVNDPCWCESGKKYKKCHQFRDKQKALHPRELDKKYREKFQFEICLHPDASTSTCSNKIIKAHTIQKKGAIAKIIDSTNHVNTFYPPYLDANTLLKLHSRGWKLASTFKGFCSTHDTSIFSDLETYAFVGGEKQCFLIGYRAMCHEMYQKIAVNSANPILKTNLDAGRSPTDQINTQNTLNTFAKGTVAGWNDITQIKKHYDSALQINDYSNVNFVVISFDGDISFVSTGAVIPDFDIKGKRLQNIEDLNISIEGLMFGIVSTDTGGAFVFSWLSKFKQCNKFIESLLAVPKDDIPSILIEFVFGYVENTYFSTVWWDSLDKAKQQRIRSLASVPVMNGDYIKYSRMKFTNWKITKITKSIK